MRAALALVVAAAGPGCGTTWAAPGERQWIANTRGVIRQLQADMGQLSGAGTRAAAGRTLTDESRLYAALVVYTDFGGCRHMVAALGRRLPGSGASSWTSTVPAPTCSGRWRSSPWPSPAMTRAS